MEPLTPSVSKAEQVHHALSAAITSAELVPGERIVIDAVARKLGVSPIPVREALRQLSSEGLVDLVPHVGARVSGVSAEQARELFELLHALELLSVRTACECATDADLDELQAIVDEMDQLERNVSSAKPLSAERELAMEAWCRQNKALHERICLAARMPLVRQMLNQAFDQWERIRRVYAKEVFACRIADAQAQHRDLLLALQVRDGQRAEEILESHNRDARENHLRELVSLVSAQASAAEAANL